MGLCVNCQRFWALVYRNSITCPQETRRSLCQHQCTKDASEQRGRAGEQQTSKSGLMPGPAVFIYIWPHSGSKHSHMLELHLSSPLEQFFKPHPTQGSAETALPTHTADLSSQTNFPPEQACICPQRGASHSPTHITAILIKTY